MNQANNGECQANNGECRIDERTMAKVMPSVMTARASVELEAELREILQTTEEYVGISNIDDDDDEEDDEPK